MKILLPCLLALNSGLAHSQIRTNFALNGQSAFIIEPTNAAAGNPWISYAPSVGSLPSWTGAGEEAWMFNEYLDAGIAIAGVYSGDLSGNPTQRAGYSALYNELVFNQGYSEKFSFHVRSRGGLLALNWAADDPSKVAAIGGIFPVSNLLSFPGAGTAANHYGLSISELTQNSALYNPIDRLAGLVANDVKIHYIHGDNDTVVPLNDNSQLLKDRYDALGGDMTLQVIPGGGHDFSSFWWNNRELTDFMIDETLTAAIPEPSSITLLGFGSFALLLRRRN